MWADSGTPRPSDSTSDPSDPPPFESLSSLEGCYHHARLVHCVATADSDAVPVVVGIGGTVLGEASCRSLFGRVLVFSNRLASMKFTERVRKLGSKLEVGTFLVQRDGKECTRSLNLAARCQYPPASIYTFLRSLDHHGYRHDRTARTWSPVWLGRLPSGAP